VWLTALNATGWRNHKDTHLSFTPGVTTFIGPNGQGKTNIVEAIRYLATLGSHRVSATAPLINDESDTATIQATLQHGDRSVDVGVTLKRKGASDAVINGNKAKVSEIPSWVSMVMFAPEDSAIVRGDPGTRRSFMDELVVAGSPRMAGTYQDFDKVLRQRNTLLKSLRHNRSGADLGTLSVWDERFAHLSAQVVVARNEHLAVISDEVTRQYQELAGGDDVTMNYIFSGGVNKTQSPVATVEDLRETLLDSLGARRSDEIERGMTLVGPHRDDVELLISQRPARTHASQGETWSLALALRLATALWLRSELSSGDPIIILDDVFAELDATRRAKLVGLVRDYEQLLITSAVEEDLPAALSGVVLDVSEGVVTPR
jgi:DNA replication and repair protein RecF